MATHLVTGYAGVEHVAAADDATLHASIVGTGKYVFDSGNKFAYEIISNNQINVKDGDLMNQGRHIKIAVNDYEELRIDNGLAGVKRYDLIVCRYFKDADTNIENAALVVVKGTSSDSPTDPEVVSGDIFSGDLIDDFPLYRVRLDGLNIVGVDCLFETIPSVEAVNAKANANAEAIQTNAKAIATNKTTIATNTSNIATNTASIQTIKTNLSNMLRTEATASKVSVPANGTADFTYTVTKAGYECLFGGIRSTGSTNVTIVGGGLSNKTTFTGTVKNHSSSAVTCYPILSLCYLKV